MKTITIGQVGAEWKVSAAAHYYAERGDGEEYAFGATPAEALANLTQRETARLAKYDENLAEEVAFLALGAAGYLRENRDANLDKVEGYMGLISEVIRCAPLLERRWAQMDAGEFGGVWLYDVTERFGREWAESLLDDGGESPEERLECIIADEMNKWAHADQ
jgi:hypothetical protein